MDYLICFPKTILNDYIQSPKEANEKTSQIMKNNFSIFWETSFLSCVIFLNKEDIKIFGFLFKPYANDIEAYDSVFI